MDEMERSLKSPEKVWRPWKGREMTTKFFIQSLGLGGVCGVRFMNGRIVLDVYKVEGNRPMNPDLFVEVYRVLMKEVERVLNMAYIPTLSSLYVLDEDDESAEMEETTHE